ncbi:MAG: four helix bundle protein [Terricaulis sp.]|nr:four helix bundle protein [Terricaulis sp.]
MGEINSYKDLRVWQTAMDIAVLVYDLTRDFPKDELYGMTSQIRRAAVSVPANIAEGFGRESSGSFVSFLRVAQGSFKELETHLQLSARVGLADDQNVAPALAQCDELGRMLRAYIRSIQRSADER